jgi:hypothetical protein
MSNLTEFMPYPVMPAILEKSGLSLVIAVGAMLSNKHNIINYVNKISLLP